jgi:hypothetical protein
MLIKKLNKLDALNTLASAYRYVHMQRGADCYAAVVIEDAFHQVRRSLQNIEEVLPVLVEDDLYLEGYNGRMPAYF